MIKRVLIAAAILVAAPGFLFAQQDLFWSFDANAAAPSTSGMAGTSGTAYLFAAETFLFDAADLNITSSDTSVLALTGGQGLDGSFMLNPASQRFDSTDLTINTPGDGRFFAVNVTKSGISTLSSLLGDPNYVAGVGHRLAEVNYDITGGGTASLEATLGTQGVVSLPAIVLDPTFAAGTLTGVAVPEPSSAILLILGSVGLVARRRRA